MTSLVDQLTHRGLVALARKYGGLLHLCLSFLHVGVVLTPDYAREVLQSPYAGRHLLELPGHHRQRF